MKRKISPELYHRIYRLAQRKVDPHLIAATVNMSYRSVQNILEKIKRSLHTHPSSHGSGSGHVEIEIGDENVSFSAMIVPKMRYSVIDFAGPLTEDTLKELKAELQEVASSEWKVVAMKLTDVTEMDDTAIETLLDFHKDFTGKGRFMAILDPSPSLEPLIQKHNLEKKISIFGTERAFEDKAFSSKVQWNKKKTESSG
jgi:anti-anti-sigma regulatory factor